MAETVEQYIARIKGLVGDKDPVDILKQTPSKLRELVAAANPATLDYRPAPGKWTIRQQVAHLVDAEVVMTSRLRWGAAQPGSAIVAFDQDKWAATAKYANIPIETSLATFTTVRAWTLDFLGRLTPAERAGHITHPERGVETVATMLTMMAGHDLNHLQQMAKLAAAAGAKPTHVM